MSGSEFVEMFVGMGASKVRDLFKQAKEKAPCIVFIDEIDAIGKKRDGQIGGNDEREQTLNQLLTEMDGFEGNNGVIILAATNRPESLDPALTRPGRFDRRVPVELPDLAGREAILKVHAKKIKTADNVDFHTIARMASGTSGAELANIINEAALRAVRSGRTVVEQADLEESIEVVIAGYQKKNAIMTDDEKKVVAYHEIGHALVAALQTASAPVQKPLGSRKWIVLFLTGRQHHRTDSGLYDADEPCVYADDDSLLCQCLSDPAGYRRNCDGGQPRGEAVVICRAARLSRAFLLQKAVNEADEEL